MARLPRLSLPGLPHHVVLSGNNNQPVFLDDTDRAHFLTLLAQGVTPLTTQLHAYVLLPNQVQLLLTPLAPDALSGLMQALGRQYVRWFNRRHGRTGTLWEGRFRSTVLQPDRYLMPCQMLIDSAPVRAGLVHEAAAYPWSSHAHYLGQRHDRWLTVHPQIWSLGNTPFAREAAYAQAVATGLPQGVESLLLGAARKGWALGDNAFLADLALRTDRRLTERRPGRPRN